jgi:hypothetical protein
VEEALQRLDQLTQEECRMAAAEVLVITRGIDDKVMAVDEKVVWARSGMWVTWSGAWTTRSRMGRGRQGQGRWRQVRDVDGKIMEGWKISMRGCKVSTSK